MTRKQEIIVTASTMFKNQGYRAVTMRLLAKEIGVKAAALYNHINSKQEILQIIAFDIAHKFTNGLIGLDDKNFTPMEKIKKVISHYIAVTIQNPNGVECLEKNWIYLEGEQLIEYRMLRENFEKNIKAIIVEGIAIEQFKKTNPDVMLQFFLYVLRSINNWYAYNTQIDEAILKEDINTLLVSALIRES